jgi:hypothetical protein
MTSKDLDILNRCHEDAIRRMQAAAVAIAEAVAEGETPSKAMVNEYKWCRLGVESTRRDLEYCLAIELAEIMDP